MGGKWLVYHTSDRQIPTPDVHYGRKNADFGQGFYLTPEREFAGRWARDRKGFEVWLNSYELDPEGLTVHRFERDGDWFDYISRNRRGLSDRLAEVDLITGPIANDTIYNTYGIFTSGVLGREETLRLLGLGPAYEQIALKTERAAARLRFLSARRLTAEELTAYRAVLQQEEAAYQLAVAKAMEET